MSSDIPLHQNLETTSVNLWSLLRDLTQKGFIGRVHVELQDYAADVFLDGSSTPLVREIDRTTNTETVEEGALHRVVLRTRETQGVINLFAGAHEAKVQPASATTAGSPPTGDRAKAPDAEIHPPLSTLRGTDEGRPVPTMDEKPPAAVITDEEVYRPGSYQDWPAILAAAGELIGAIERGVNASGNDFTSVFAAVRLELADDYVFLDPFAQTMRYADGVVAMKTEPDVTAFVNGLSEALRRAVNLVAVGDRARRVRERVALELLAVARRRTEVLERSGWRAQLDRIAGTAVM